MHTRLTLAAFAAGSALIPAPAGASQELIIPQGAAAGAIVGAPAPAAGPAGGGELDFNRLRQLIEQSREQPELTPAQQRLAILQELRFDRSTAGILAARLEEARAGDPPELPEQELERFKVEAQSFHRDVVLGRWDQVRDFLAALPEDAATPAYQLLLEKLSAPVPVQPPPELAAQGAKPHTQPAYLPPDDFLGLLSCAPQPPDKEQMAVLAKLLPKAPRPPEAFFDGLEKGVPHFGGEAAEDRRRVAELLLESGFVREAGRFLPDPAEARGDKNYAAINLIARHRSELAQRHPREAGEEALPLAWELSTSFLTDTEAPIEARGEALFRALSLIPELGDGTGRAWLEKTFRDPDGEGLELLAALGTLTAQSQENPDAEVRLGQLRLQHAAVQALLDRDAADASAWAGVFTLYARQWAHEAEVTRQKDQSGSRRMVRSYDEWGNLFFTRPDTNYQGDGTRPITAGEMLECRPDDKWLAVVEPSTRNACLFGAARLLLKVKEENNALPLVAALAESHRDEAVELVKEVIRVWAENHNPNTDQQYRSQYMYFYGFNNQSGTIPLTRSKQERNLMELAELVEGIRALDLDESFHRELADAFISCHSQAEVWRVEAIESVFGATDALDAATLATLVGRMRLNLAGLWPDPRLQQAYQTKRKDKELQEQILHGYAAAIGVLERALAREPKEPWRLEQQLAALRFEESNYRSTLEPDNQHSATKRAALDALATAAENYAAALPLDAPDRETSEVFETWFFAALGSPTLEALKGHHVATPTEFPRIKSALEALPDPCRERHLEAFAKTLNTRLANVSPDLKLRYLEGASRIAGDHDELKDAAEVLAYYRDLITEIELHAAIDGPDRVEPGEPFGLRVNIRHTREIERESGGFQRYLQNQTNAQYGWNFGRPLEDYRDKFEKAARAVLEEHFEVVSLTFHSEKVESRTDAEFGWRLTPYAYFLLEPKGPQIDRIPPLKIDLDFNDTSGYVVLPIASSEIPIDAAGGEPRPFRDLRLTQTLDERSHAEKGSLFLEIKAAGHGLVPPLEDLLDLELPGFETGEIEDRGLRVVELDPQTDDLAPLSEHEWRVELKPAGGALPASFRFPETKTELAAEDGLVLQRYVDVDLVPVSGEVALSGETRRLTPWLASGLVALLAASGGWIVYRRRRRPTDDGGAVVVPLPARINAVSVIGYLRRLRQQDGLPENVSQGIDEEIKALEIRHFGRNDTPQDEAELEQIARRWQTAV